MKGKKDSCVTVMVDLDIQFTAQFHIQHTFLNGQQPEQLYWVKPLWSNLVASVIWSGTELDMKGFNYDNRLSAKTVLTTHFTFHL